MADVRVFRPKSLGGLLRLYARNPDALLYAGGTALVPQLRGPAGGSLELPPKVIYLGNVVELGRISRTQRYLDIGTTLSLARIMSVGRNVLPKVLQAALGSVANPSVRNLATLGGNLCSGDGGGDTLPALSAVGAQVELRSLGTTRWLRVERFAHPTGAAVLRPGEIACRVRVPLEEWDFQVYRKVGRRHGSDRACLSLAGVARLPKGTLEALHCSFGGLGLGAVPGREIEARLKSARLPLAPKTVDALLEELRRLLESRMPAAVSGGGQYRPATALRLFRWFLAGLNEKSLETL
jgi:CO/xanthine dehydrogenase FAD-binding subunit